VTHRESPLLVVLVLDTIAARVEVGATAPDAQLGKAKRNDNHLSSVVLARAIRTKVGVGQLKLVLPLGAEGAQALKRRRHLALTVTATITSSSGERQMASHTITLTGRHQATVAG
jgi:hypothetical protein